MQTIKLRKSRYVYAAIAALLAQFTAPLLIGTASAAPQFDSAFVRLDTHVAGATTGGTVCATPSASGVGTESYVTVTFPTVLSGGGHTDFALAANTRWIVSNANLPAGSTFWPLANGTAATSVTGKTVRFNMTGGLTDGTTYCFRFVDDGTNPAPLTNSSAGYDIFDSSTDLLQADISTFDGSNALIEQTNWNTAIIADDTLTVSAVVPPLFQMEFLDGVDPNEDSFGNLNPSSIVSTTGEPVQFKTNAKGGWIAWAKSLEAGLVSSSAGDYKIDTAGSIDGAPTTLTPGTEGYVMDVDINGGLALDDAAPQCDANPESPTALVAIDAEYDADNSTNHGGTLSAVFQPIGTCSGPAPATSAGDILMVVLRAAISFNTPAATDYADVITIVGAGNF